MATLRSRRHILVGTADAREGPDKSKRKSSRQRHKRDQLSVTLHHAELKRLATNVTHVLGSFVTQVSEMDT